MAVVFILVLTFISVLMTPATSQLDIVNVRTIEDGSPFTITCNAQRVITSQTANFSTIDSLQIDAWNNGADKYNMVAQYNAFGPPGTLNGTQLPPAGRNWKFSFSGSNGGGNNRATMKIEILVPTGKCEDAGLYRCTMGYYISTTVFTDSSEQNVTSTATTTEPLAVLDPVYGAEVGVSNRSTYDVGENITVTCRFEGPEQLSMKWKRERRPAIGIDVQFDDYAIANDITTDAPTRVPGTSQTCPQYSHRSVLKLTISPEDNNDRQYLCVVMSGEEEQASSAVYIDVNEGRPTPPTGGSSGGSSQQSSKADIGLIVGVTIGCIVAVIIIIVIIVCCCLRSKRNQKSANDTDRPDGGHNQPAPPPVLYSRPNKGINNNNSSSRNSQVPAGKVNEALNNSYDSKDSGHKAPPVYTITNQRQPYPGRQNQAYDAEDNSANRQPQESDPRYYNYEPKPPGRRYSTDDNTDAHRDYYEDENFGTGV